MKKIAMMILTLGVALGGLALNAEARGGGNGWGGCPGWRDASTANGNGYGRGYGRGYGPGNCPAYAQGSGAAAQGSGYGPGYGRMMYGPGNQAVTPEASPSSPSTAGK